MQKSKSKLKYCYFCKSCHEDVYLIYRDGHHLNMCNACCMIYQDNSVTQLLRRIK